MLRRVPTKWLMMCVLLAITGIAPVLSSRSWDRAFAQTPGSEETAAVDKPPVSAPPTSSDRGWILLLAIIITGCLALGNVGLSLVSYRKSRKDLEELIAQPLTAMLNRLAATQRELTSVGETVGHLSHQVRAFPEAVRPLVTTQDNERPHWEEFAKELERIDKSFAELDVRAQRLEAVSNGTAPWISELLSRLPDQQDFLTRRADVIRYYSRLLEMVSQSSHGNVEPSTDRQYLDTLDFVVNKLERLRELFPQDQEGMIVESLRRARSVAATGTALQWSIDRLILPDSAKDLLQRRLAQEAEILSDPSRIPEFGDSDAVAEEIGANPVRAFERYVRKSILEVMNKPDNQVGQTPKAFLVELRKKMVFELLNQIENRLEPDSDRLRKARDIIREMLERIGLEEVPIILRKDTFKPREHVKSGEVLVERPATGTIVSVAQMGVRSKKTGEVLRTPGVVVAKNPPSVG